MRFRAKFQWLQVTTAILWIGLSYAWIHRATAPPGLRVTYLLTGIVQLFALLFYVAMYVTSWEIDEDALVQRRLWSARRVPWDEIARIGPSYIGKNPKRTWVEVEYARSAPMSERGTLLLQPEDRDGLIQELRSHAPQAEFEPFPVKG
jgi:hypothetical protein